MNILIRLLIMWVPAFVAFPLRWMWVRSPLRRGRMRRLRIGRLSLFRVRRKYRVTVLLRMRYFWWVRRWVGFTRWVIMFLRYMPLVRFVVRLRNRGSSIVWLTLAFLVLVLRILSLMIVLMRRLFRRVLFWSLVRRKLRVGRLVVRLLLRLVFRRVPLLWFRSLPLCFRLRLLRFISRRKSRVDGCPIVYCCLRTPEALEKIGGTPYENRIY